MMDGSLIANILALAFLVGFGTFCLSYSIAVWRRRNQTENPAHPGAARRLLKPAAWLLAMSGGGLLAFAFVRLETANRQGQLRTDSLFTVRIQDGMEPVRLHPDDLVEEGAVLASFLSPERQARLRVLSLQKERFLLEKEVLLSRPLDLDPELVRNHQRAALDLQVLRSSLDQLLPARESVIREGLRDCLDRERRIRELEIELTREKKALAQAESRHAYLEKLAKQTGELSRQQMVSETALAAAESDREVAAQEVVKYREWIQSMAREKAEVQAALDRFARLAETQAAELDQELARSRRDLEEARQREAELSRQLAVDRQRATAHREGRLAQLDLQVRECDAEAGGIQGVLAIQAPFAGRVVFREPSPRTAFRQAPLLVVARGDGFPARLLLTREEAELLAETDGRELTLLAAAGGLRFPARFVVNTAMPGQDDYLQTELRCQPPEECIRALARGEEVPVDLAWRPPLHRLALARLGGLLLLAGLACGLLPLAGEPRRAAAAAVPPPPAMAFGDIEGVLEIQALRFLETLRRGEVAEEQLAALEWSLDRHHQLAVAGLRRSLEKAADLPAAAQDLLRDLAERARTEDEESAREAEEVRRRLLAILRIVAPRAIRPAPLGRDPILGEIAEGRLRHLDSRG